MAHQTVKAWRRKVKHIRGMLGKEGGSRSGDALLGIYCLAGHVIHFPVSQAFLPKCHVNYFSGKQENFCIKLSEYIGGWLRENWFKR